MRLNDPELVRRQYASEDGLAVRRDFQRRFRHDLIDGIIDGDTRAKLLALMLPRPQ